MGNINYPLNQWKIYDNEIAKHCGDYSDESEEGGGSGPPQYGWGINATFSFNITANKTWNLIFNTYDTGDTPNNGIKTSL